VKNEKYNRPLAAGVVFAHRSGRRKDGVMIKYGIVYISSLITKHSDNIYKKTAFKIY